MTIDSLMLTFHVDRSHCTAHWAFAYRGAAILLDLPVKPKKISWT
jgi:hypothetical protein